MTMHIDYTVNKPNVIFKQEWVNKRIREKSREKSRGKKITNEDLCLK